MSLNVKLLAMYARIKDAHGERAQRVRMNAPPEQGLFKCGECVGPAAQRGYANLSA